MSSLKAIASKVAKVEDIVEELDRKILENPKLYGFIVYVTNPDNFRKTQKQMSIDTGIPQKTISNYLRNPTIQQRLTELRRAALIDVIQEVLEASIATATTPGRDGYNDRRLLLEMTGDIGSRNNNLVDLAKQGTIKVEFNFVNDWGVKKTGNEEAPPMPEINITEEVNDGSSS